MMIWQVILALSSLIFSCVFTYLRMNKFWIWRHKKEVSDSISLIASMLILGANIPLVTVFLMSGNWILLFDVAALLVRSSLEILLVLIAVGFWVKGYRNVGLWQMATRTFYMELKHVTDLTRTLLRPSNDRLVREILFTFATIDDDLDERELSVIKKCKKLKDWKLSPEVSTTEAKVEKPEKLTPEDHILKRSEKYMHLHELIDHYLEKSPPSSDVIKLKDAIYTLITADEVMSQPEQVAFYEVEQRLLHYLDSQGEQHFYDLYVIPQDEQHEEGCKSLLPLLQLSEVRAAKLYFIARYYSEPYAAAVASSYRKKGLPTFVARHYRERVA